MGKGLDFKMGWTPDTKSTERFIKVMPGRINTIADTMLRITAEELMVRVKKKLPRGRDYDDIRKSIQLSTVPSAKGSSAFSVSLPSSGKNIRKVDAPRTVIYVRAKTSRMDRKDKRVQFLEDNGPWTTDTIPFWPSKSTAIIVQRRVSKREADQVSATQAKNSSKIRSQLALLSSGPLDKAANTKKMKRNKPFSDTSFAAVRAEFGGDGQRAVPAWKTSMQSIVNDMKKPDRMVAKYPHFKKMISHPTSSSYNKMPPIKKKTNLQVAKGFMPFMKKMGFV